MYPSGGELMEGHPTEKSRDQICIAEGSFWLQGLGKGGTEGWGLGRRLLPRFRPGRDTHEEDLASR